MCLRIYNIVALASALRTALAPAALVAGLVALATFTAAPAGAVPPAGPTDIAAEEQIGVTLYQASGLHGKIPLKKVQVADPSGDTSHYELQFASGSMNTKMDFQAKFVLPSGMVFTGFEVSTTNGNVNVTPAGADSWDGQTMIDKVTVSPWNMNRVLQQCIDHLTKPDGTFKDSATFDLQADVTELVRGKGICKFPNAPPGSSMSDTAKVKPRTRVTAYIIEESRIGSGSREPQKLSSDRPARQPSGQSGTNHIICDDHKVIGTRPTSQGSSSPRPTSSGRVTAGSSSTAIKDTFDRPKPHVNMSIDLPLKRGTVGQSRRPQP